MSARTTPPWISGAALGVILFGVLSASAGWAWSHGVLFAGMGALMVIAPGCHAMPRYWVALAVAFALLASACFLPADWFGVLPWRQRLEELGVDTGDSQVIQVRPAIEMLAVFLLTLAGGLWLAMHRFNGPVVRAWSLVFTFAVAILAVMARLWSDHLARLGSDGHFGFFPNRNHMATLLAMGAVVALGCLVQFVRDRSPGRAAVASIAGLINVFALLSWSISRAGFVLLAAGVIGFFALLRRGYLGKDARWAVCLLGLAMAGGFLLTDNRLKDRVGAALLEAGPLAEADTASGGALRADLRWLIWKDAVSMIRAAPWTGHGPGQFAAVFPQYRHRASTANETDSVHPESDWLWLAAETGVPATLVMAALVGAAFCHSLGRIRRGRRQAVRLGCLVAASLVAIHGIFDVPGHRVPLAWAAAFLFGLSLGEADDSGIREGRNWTARFSGILLLVSGGWLVAMAPRGIDGPAVTVVDVTRREVLDLCRRDEELQQQAIRDGRVHQPLAGEDLLEQALGILDSSLERLPMARDLYHLQGRVGLHFDDKQTLVERSFAIELALDPRWVEAPARQGVAWFPADRARALASFADAMARAKRHRELHPDTRFSEAWVIRSARDLAPRDESWSREVQRLEDSSVGKE